MGQSEVLDWLVMMRHTGSEEFFSTRQVRDGLERTGHVHGTAIWTVSNHLRTLSKYGLIDARRKSPIDLLVVFRAKLPKEGVSHYRDSRQIMDHGLINNTYMPNAEQKVGGVK